ncbi:dihydrodipicolinate synthase family protein [Ramlibacter sp. AW1]|uniref:Dihydrodipicolinate synthase family protein n=1 Tax=Ramlibacter aurantiacus TaxID=2801330 RepID=A0A936ZLZ9_9BURK|nr:dihydrodipicolinate synthase family protein [Ramlibacter aurantiacus]MBL0422638.1 dihydrodipicolinate synthase family protein [Ramlibacter aurantiacus]
MDTPIKLPGLIVPPLTPFTAELKVDEKALLAGVDYVVEDCNAAMVIAAGVEAQEYHYLTLEERKHLIDRTFEYVDRRRPVAVGISHPSFKIAVELAHHAQRIGADAVQLLAPLRPFGGEPTQQELLDYFELISRETDLPVILYLNPGPGANVSIADTIALAKLERVKYVKESSRDLSRVSRLIAEIELEGHAKYFTTMQMLLITLELGGSGITLPPPAAMLANKVIQAFVAGDMKEAARLQLQFALFPARWMHHGLTPTLKAALKILGISAGDPYPPYPPISGKDLQALEAYIKRTDLELKT